MTTDGDGPKARDRVSVEGFPARAPAGYEIYHCRRWWGASFSPGLLSRLLPMIRWADVVHLTAVYSSPTVPTLSLCKALGKPVVWSPRGALQRWAGTTRRGAKKAWETCCDLLCDPSRVCLHVTSEAEMEESQGRVKRARAVIIPNGVDVPPGETLRRRQPKDDLLRLLYLGRLHPIKGVENLLRAVARSRRAVTLTICGDGDAQHRRALELLADKLSLGDRVRFDGMVTGDKKVASFLEADVCVVPSFKENFGMVVVEALARGVPVIVSRGAPWRRVQEEGCGVWVDNDPETLTRAIEQVSQMPLREMGRRGREWMEREFAWSSVAERMARVYQNLLERSA